MAAPLAPRQQPNPLPEQPGTPKDVTNHQGRKIPQPVASSSSSGTSSLEALKKVNTKDTQQVTKIFNNVVANKENFPSLLGKLPSTQQANIRDVMETQLNKELNTALKNGGDPELLQEFFKRADAAGFDAQDLLETTLDFDEIDVPTSKMARAQLTLFLTAKTGTKHEALPKDRLIASLTDALQKLPGEQNEKRLNPIESHELALFIESASKKQAGGQTAIFYPSHETKLARTLIFDPKSNSVIVLSKKASLLTGRGAEKKASNAVRLTMNPDPSSPTGITLTVSKQTRLVNWTRDVDRELIQKQDAKETVTLLAKEMKLMQRFSNSVLLIVKHTSREKRAKIDIIVESYDKSLKDLSGSDKAAERRKVFHAVASQLSQVHEAGFAHFDLNSDNIRLNDAGQAMLIDYGHAHNMQDYPKYIQKGYGQQEFSSPENFDPKYKTFVNSMDGSKAADMFALGCLYYQHLYNTTTTPWYQATKMSRAIDGDPKGITDTQMEMQKTYEAIKTEFATCSDPIRKKELEICLGLLNPNPAERMTARQLEAKLAS